jgi:hypothetical protein
VYILITHTRDQKKKGDTLDVQKRKTENMSALSAK